MKIIAAFSLCVAAAWPAAPVMAQPAGDDPASAPLCTDRPTKANTACTVPAGSVQLEADAINWTRTSARGIAVDTILYTNPTVKLGLGGATDVEVTLPPFETVHTHGDGAGNTLRGIGDLTLRLKQRLTDADAKVQVALIPFVKAPTAKLGIGNDRWEGGVAAPIIFPLPSGFTLNLGPELDLLADADGAGHHPSLVSVANLSHALGSKATISAEFWNAQNLDPRGTTHQYSGDVALAYLLAPTLQLDLGGNFGLNRSTPDTQIYLGLATRF